MTAVEAIRLRARSMGIDALALDERMDLRPDPERWTLPKDPDVIDPDCPTCDDGVLTITHNRRCRECTRKGL